MSSQTQQIIKCYEELHLGLGEISEQFPQYDVTEIKTLLMSYSAQYRKDVNSTSESNSLDFSDDDLLAANAAIKQLMLTTEDENVRFRCAKYLRDDKKGRKDVLKSLTGLRIDVMAFNDRFERMKLAEAKTFGGEEQKVIEVGGSDD